MSSQDLRGVEVIITDEQCPELLDSHLGNIDRVYGVVELYTMSYNKKFNYRDIEILEIYVNARQN